MNDYLGSSPFKPNSSSQKRGEVSLKTVDPATISYTYWVLPCLEELSKIEEVDKFFRDHSRESVERLWKGYAFALVIILGRLADQVLVASPFAEWDFMLSCARGGEVPFERMPVESPLGEFLWKIVSLYVPLRGVNSRTQVFPNIQRIRDSLLLPMGKAFSASIEVNPRVRQATALNVKQVLERLGLVNTHLFLCDRKQVEITFRSTYHRSKGPVRSRIPKDYYAGYKLSLAFLLSRFTNTSPHSSIRSLLKTRSWRGLDKTYRSIQYELVDPIERKAGLRYDHVFTQGRPLSEAHCHELVACNYALPFPTPTKEEEVRKALLWYPAKEVGLDGITWPGVYAVIILVEGVQGYQKEETVRVARFDHGGPEDTGYSFGVLVPSSSNYSEWWIFPDFCSKNYGTGAAGFSELSEYLHRLKSRVKDKLSFETVQVEKEQFLKIIRKDADFEHRPTEYSQTLQQLIESARGWVLELVASNLAGSKGYACFHRVTRAMAQVLGDYEIDVVGVKSSDQGADILLVESSAGFAKRDVQGLKSKLGLVRKHSAELLAQLGLPSATKTSVEGWLLTAQRLSAKQKRLKTMRVIDSIELDRLPNEKVLWKEMSDLFPQTRPRERVRHIRNFRDFQRFTDSLHRRDV